MLYVLYRQVNGTVMGPEVLVWGGVVFVVAYGGTGILMLYLRAAWDREHEKKHTIVGSLTQNHAEDKKEPSQNP